MKKNNKGFMLVEVIIVTVVVVSIMTSLFVLFNKIYNNYDRKSTYTNIDGIYALKLLKDNSVSSSILTSTNDNYYLEIICDNSDNYCKAVFSEYNVNKLYVVKNNITSLNSLRATVTNQTFKDYIDYLKNIGINNDSAIKSLMLMESYTVVGDNNTAKYAYLTVK